MSVRRCLSGALVGAAAALLVACGSAAEPASRTLADVPFNMKYGYIDNIRSMGVTGVSDEQLLAAGMYVCSNFGAYTKDADPADRRAAVDALYATSSTSSRTRRPDRP